MDFAVLMPVYFKENPEFLRTALRTVLDDQTVKPNELILVEDGPLTDELYTVLQEIEGRHPHIVKRYALKQNSGMGIAMNLGLEKATCTWVARMDSDDIAKADRFEIQTAFLREHPEVDVLGTYIEEFNVVVGDLKSERHLPIRHADIMKFMRKRNPINHMTVIFRREVALRAGGYWSERYFEDYNLWYEMSKVGAVFHNLPVSLVHVRVGNDMITRRSGYAYFEYEKLLLDKFFRDGFLTLPQYLTFLSIRFTLRLVPTGILRSVYRLFLRK